MSRTARWVIVPALVAGWLGAAAPAPAALAPEVRDEAKLFKPETVAKANATLREIKDRYKKDLLIETYPEIPADRKKDYKPEEKGAFFQKWARDRARAVEVNGVYILICKEPKHLQVEVGNETRKKAFTTENRDDLAKLLTDKFRKSDWDGGLTEGVDFVETKLRTNLGRTSEATPGAARPAPPVARGGDAAHVGGDDKGSGIMGWICIGLVVLLGVWVLFGLIRAFTGGGARGGYGPGYGGGGGYGPGYGGGGGGFLSSLVGGMFGAAAGMWMYNNVFGGHTGGFGGSAYGGGPDYGNTGAAAPEDTDYTGSGGDFGGDDAGGGGGGGDFGGGGGDFGGGGGDF